MPKPTEIVYESVAGIALTIRPPGSWFDSKDFVVFLNGDGVGHRRTLKAAERLLFASALEEIRARQDQARRDQAYYEQSANELIIGGVKQKGRG